MGFPRPLTPFERYMLLDARPGYPMTFMGQADLDGVFEPRRLEAAVRTAHARHPMLRTTVRDRRMWREPSPADELSPLQWLPWSEHTPHEAFRSIDVSREIGVRLFVQQRRDRSRLTLQCHHAVADGLGMMRFGRDLLAAYVAATRAPGADPDARTGEEPTGSEPRPARAEAAGEAPMGGVPAPSGPPFPISDIVGFLLRRPARIRASRRPGTPTSPSAPLLHHTFRAPAVGRIRRLADAHEASVNDVFLSALLQTLAEWNGPASRSRRKRWLRVLVPTDLRTRRDGDRGVGNALGFAFVERRESVCGDPAALLRGIAQEMRDVRLAGSGRRILDGLALVDRVPGLLRLILRPRRTLATVVFSNVGRVRIPLPGGRSGRSEDPEPALPTLLTFTGAPPLRPGTRAGFVLSRVRGALTLTLRTDPRHLDAEASASLLTAYVGKVNDMSRDDSLSKGLPSPCST